MTTCIRAKAQQLVHTYYTELRALESSLISKLRNREWDNCRATLIEELRAVRAEIREVSFWTDTAHQPGA